ncbi:unnamed protein product [Adineta ricciae]|uniref:Major facilitator superfamily (MFS) profile domain-containing protein n=1 Tax=Adineta ricciae TaxID=249248 RepID=A0A814WHD3_ADIRI|nr:unnamed protein product [Adineta ricciae]CAF1596037.1 unnamed protein product [Adineta ricciae]
MSSVQEESVADDDVTPSNSQTVPETTVTLSTNDTLVEPIKQKWTVSLLISIIIVVASTSFVMGVNIGGPNLYNGFVTPWARGYPFPCQKEDNTSQWIAREWWNCVYNDTRKNENGFYYLPEVPKNQLITQGLRDSLHNVLFVIGGFIGAYSGQYWYKCLSRRNAIFANMPFQIIASVFMIITLYIYHGYEKADPNQETIDKARKHKDVAIAFFYISRFLSGFAAGMCCVVSTSYLNEISPRALRGTVGSCHQLAIVIGIFIGQIVGLPWILGRHNTWNWGMAWVGLLSLIGAVFIWTLPESPRWLIQQRKPNEAAQSLRKLRQSNDIESELIEIEQEETATAKKELGIGKVLSSKEFRWPLITSLLLNAAQQLSGINAVFFYSRDMFTLAGLRDEKVFWGILATGVINLIATLVALKLIELWGRRPLIIWPLAVIIGVMIGLTIFIVVNSRNSENQREALAIVSIVFILIFIILFAIGLGPIPYVFSNEVFAVEACAAGLSLAMFVNWFCNFLVALLFLPLQSAIGGYVFLIFCIFVAIAFVVLFLKMPETKNKLLPEIEAFWK